MKRRFLLCSIALAGALWATGCVSTVDGRQRLGNPLVNDTFEARYERPVLDCWAAAKDVLIANGQLTSEDHQRSTLQANINKRIVWVKVEPLDHKVTRVIIQARTSGGGSDKDLTAEIKAQITARLATDNLSPATSPRSGK
jgi:hypothetical protein